MAAREVILYFDDQSDALRFALAAGSVMSGESKAPEQLVQETQRASRVKLGHAVSSQKSASLSETSGHQ